MGSLCGMGRVKTARVSDLLRLPDGPVDLTAMGTGGTPGFSGAGKAEVQAHGHRRARLLERLPAGVLGCPPEM